MSIENQPHVTIATMDGNAHVIPVACIQRVIDGDLPFAEVEGCNEIVRPILREWLESLSKKAV